MVCEMPPKAPHEHTAVSFHGSELRARTRLQVQAPGLITSETVEELLNFSDPPYPLWNEYSNRSTSKHGCEHKVCKLARLCVYYYFIRLCVYYYFI